MPSIFLRLLRSFVTFEIPDYPTYGPFCVLHLLCNMWLAPIDHEWAMIQAEHPCLKLLTMRLH